MPLESEAWYVRPPSGGQYGPATRDEVERWQLEGRIPPESFVWREGWSDWRTAAEELAPASPDAIVRAMEPATIARADPTTLQTGLRGSDAKKRKRATIVILLMLACALLLVLFLFVLQPGVTSG
jgi:hypothetical protein